MVTYIALYRGPTIAESRLISVSSDPKLVRAVAERMIESEVHHDPDPAIGAVARGRCRALRLVVKGISNRL